jgi:hypothetical protein
MLHRHQIVFKKKREGDAIRSSDRYGFEQRMLEELQLTKKASYQAVTFSAIQGIPILHDLFTRLDCR